VCAGVEWIKVAGYSVVWCELVNTIMNLSVFIKGTIIFERKTDWKILKLGLFYKTDAD
jgi:hypothetical protein